MSVRARLRAWVQFLGVLLCFAGACGGRQDVSSPGMTVEQFQAQMNLRPDGSADIEETWIVSGAGGATLRRAVPVARRDALSGLAATLDDQPVAAGPGEVVSWSLPADGGRHTARLRYRAAGIIEVSGLHGTVGWPALEAGRHPAIAHVRLSLAVPDAMSVASPARMSESGWHAETHGSLVSAERRSMPVEGSATLIANLIIEPGTMARPVWQENAERGTLLIPAFLSGGLFILVVGLGVIVMVAVQGTGWTPAERAAATRGFFSAAMVALVFGAIAWMVTPMLLGRFGPWPLAIPASILLVGVLFVLTALALRHLWKTTATR